MKSEGVDYRKMVSMPIRDMSRDGVVVFVVDVYGLETKDIAVVPGGSAPFRRAVERLGLDPERYQAVLWDAMASNQRVHPWGHALWSKLK